MLPVTLDAKAIERDQFEGIDKQPLIPIGDVSIADVPSPKTFPLPIIPKVTTGGFFEKVKVAVEGGESVVPIGKTNPITLYIIIGTVCLIGFIAVRRR